MILANGKRARACTTIPTDPLAPSSLSSLACWPQVWCCTACVFLVARRCLPHGDRAKGL